MASASATPRGDVSMSANNAELEQLRAEVAALRASGSGAQAGIDSGTVRKPMVRACVCVACACSGDVCV
jgi:hypothetical protein